jgi:general secretion pathway protein E
VEFLYKAFTPSEEDKKICAKCSGKGYRGRVAVFEFLPFDDRMKEVMTASPRLDVLRADARKAGIRTLQEEGILLACRGITSLEELRRGLTEQ